MTDDEEAEPSPLRRRDPIPWKEWCAYIEKRRAEVGELVVPRNTGNRRTESKKALLKAIRDAGGSW